MEYYIQLLGYYYGTLPGMVIYENYDDFLSMIYKQQTIDNLAAAKKAQYIVFLPKNYKANDPLNGIGGIGGGHNDNINGIHSTSSSPLSSSRMRRNSGDSGSSNSSPYDDPKSRVSATH